MQREPNYTPTDNQLTTGIKASENSSNGDKNSTPVLNRSMQGLGLGSPAEAVDDGNLETDSIGRRLQAQDRSTNPFSMHSPEQVDRMLIPQPARSETLNLLREGDIESHFTGRAVPFVSPDEECAAILAQNHKEEVKPERVQSHLTDPAWTLMPNCFIEQGGYRLGVKDCRHFKGPNGVVVEVQNGKNFEVLLGNLNSTRCNVDILVNGKLVAVIQLQQHQIEFLLEGPILTIDDCYKKFVFLRSRDAPSEAAINVKSPDNGVVEARFVPEKCQKKKVLPSVVRRYDSYGIKARSFQLQTYEPDDASKSAARSAPKTQQQSADLNPNNARPVPPPRLEKRGEIPTPPEQRDRTVSGAGSGDPGLWCGGAVALQESTEKREYDLADDIKIDESKTVILKVRMVARTDDESKPNPQETITPLYKSVTPPPLPI